MSEQFTPTPGPWTVEGESATEPDVMSGEFYVAQCFGFEDGGEALDNARLIADAGTVYGTTGLTPSQLVERVKDLEEALGRYMSAFGQALEAHGVQFGPQQHAADAEARAALSKARPNTAEGEAK